MSPQQPSVPAAKPAPKKDVDKPERKKFELNSKNLRLLLVASLLAMVVIFAAIMFLGLSALGGKSQNLVDLRSKSQAADNELLNLEQSKKDVEKYAYFKDVAKTVIPNDKDQAQAVLDIFQMANDAGISLQSVTFPNSNLGATASPLGATPGTTTPTVASASNALTQAQPVAGVPGLYSLALNITPDTASTADPSKTVTYAKMLAFLSNIENDRRTAQITNVTIQPPSSGTQSLSFTLTVNIFIKPS